jgi:hypothetical protein
MPTISYLILAGALLVPVYAWIKFARTDRKR